MAFSALCRKSLFDRFVLNLWYHSRCCIQYILFIIMGDPEHQSCKYGQIVIACRLPSAMQEDFSPSTCFANVGRLYFRKSRTEHERPYRKLQCTSCDSQLDTCLCMSKGHMHNECGSAIDGRETMFQSGMCPVAVSSTHTGWTNIELSNRFGCKHRTDHQTVSVDDSGMLLT